jgi:hypothetical protein
MDQMEPTPVRRADIPEFRIDKSALSNTRFLQWKGRRQFLFFIGTSPLIGEFDETAYLRGH